MYYNSVKIKIVYKNTIKFRIKNSECRIRDSDEKR